MGIVQWSEWLKRNNVQENALDKFDNSDNLSAIESIKDVQILLAFGYEFYVLFRGKEYFISASNETYWITNEENELLYKTDDLDDFGENARIGENGEFLLKDVASELE